MRRHVLGILVALIFSQSAAAQDGSGQISIHPAYQNFLGPSFAMQLSRFETGTDQMTYSIGIAFGSFLTEGFGFVSLSSLAVPILVDTDGFETDSLGLVADSTIGLGNTFAIPIAQNFGGGVGMIMLGGGIHINVTSISDLTGQLGLFSLGPAVIFGSGNSRTSIRGLGEIHFDLLSFPFYAVAFGTEYEVADFQSFGQTFTLGLSF